jgi:hypothetical protein
MFEEERSVAPLEIMKQYIQQQRVMRSLFRS